MGGWATCRGGGDSSNTRVGDEKNLWVRMKKEEVREKELHRKDKKCLDKSVLRLRCVRTEKICGET